VDALSPAFFLVMAEKSDAYSCDELRAQGLASTCWKPSFKPRSRTRGKKAGPRMVWGNTPPSPLPSPTRGEGTDLLRRAISWYYQWLLVKSTAPPEHSITVRFEDFVLKQEETLLKLEDFLGFRLVRIPVKPERVSVWKNHPQHRDFDFLQEPLRELGYA